MEKKGKKEIHGKFKKTGKTERLQSTRRFKLITDLNVTVNTGIRCVLIIAFLVSWLIGTPPYTDYHAAPAVIKSSSVAVVAVVVVVIVVVV